MLIQSIYTSSLQTFCHSGGPTKEITYVQCILDSNSDGTADTGACSGFHTACSTNLQDYCNTGAGVTGHTGFSTAVSNQRIDDEDIKQFYQTAVYVANNRSFTTPTISSTVTGAAIIDDQHHDTLKSWVDGTFGFAGTSAIGTTQTENVGDVIDASGWISIRDKLKNVAKLCNDVSHCDCNEVCSCNDVCTCNCDSNY